MRREQRTTTKSNPIAGRPSPCSSPRTVATTTWADICRPQGQKTKFESCVTDVVKITDTGLKIIQAEELSIGDKVAAPVGGCYSVCRMSLSANNGSPLRTTVRRCEQRFAVANNGSP